MGKTLKIVLYVLSVLLLIMIALFVVRAVLQNNGVGGNENTMDAVLAEENQTESGETAENESEDAGSRETEDQELETGMMSSEMAEPDQTGTVSMIFTGDVLLGNSVLGNYDSKGINGILSEDLINELNSADIVMVNEEFPFSTRGTQMEDKQYTFRTDPSYVKALKEMNVSIVSLANNHILDFGTDALMDTCDTLDGAGILYTGAGENLERAGQLQIIEKNGKKFGFLAASRVWPEAWWGATANGPGVFGTYDSSLLVSEIEAAKAECDFLTVFVHWGVEYQENPEEYQRSLSQKYTGAGADLVIGAHTHCLQGVEYFDEKPVFYSLGNFVFGMDTDQAAVVKVTVEDSGAAVCKLIPAASHGAYTYGLTGNDASNLYQYIENISFEVSVDENGIVYNKR